MYIKFKNIKIENFLSIGNITYNLDKNGFVIVTGRNENTSDNAKGNGSGKSSIFEAILYVLTGETLRGTRDVVNKYTPDGLYIELDFDIDDVTYKLIRTREHKDLGTNLKLYVNNIDKSGKGIKDTEKILSDYLPDLTPQLINSVIILGQGLPQRFTNNTPSGRKEVLEKLSKSDFMIDDIKDRIKIRYDDLNNQLNQLKLDLNSNTTKQNIYEGNLEDLKNKLNELDDLDNITKKINALTCEKNSLDKLIDDCKNNVLDIKNQVEIINSQLSVIEKTKNNDLSKLQDKFSIENNDQVIHITELKTAINSLKSEINRLASIKDICPTCGQKLPHVHKIDTSDLENQISQKQIILDEKLKLNSDLLSDYNKSKADINLCYENDLYNLNEELRDLKINLSKEQSDLDKHTNNYNNITKELDENIFRKNNLESNKLKYTNDIIQLESTIEKIKNNILYNNIEIDNINNHISIISKMNTIVIRDFRGILLSNIIEYIELKSKEYAKEIFDHDQISFTLDKNNILIKYMDRSYEGLSGGEKQKIDIIIQFAIRDMLVKFLNFSSNIIVLDEIFDNLDSIGCQEIIDLILNKLTDIESIYIITHHQNELDIPFDNKITIVKENNGVSRLE